MSSLDAFAGAPIRMRDAPFARLRDAWRDVLDLLSGRLDDDWHQRVRDNSWKRAALKAAADFEAAGMDGDAAANRILAMGARK